MGRATALPFFCGADMQIEILKDAVTSVGRLKKCDALNIADSLAQTLITLGVAKIREVATTTEKTHRTSKKAKK